MPIYLLLFDSYGLVFVGRPLWREDGSVCCMCCWPLPAQLLHSLFFISTHRHHGKHHLYCCSRHCLRGNVFTEPLLRNGLHNSVLIRLLGAAYVTKHSLIYCCMLDHVYRAVAWRRVYEICYNILKINIPSVETTVEKTQIEHLTENEVASCRNIWPHKIIYIYRVFHDFRA
jgi:hypothetical protein